MRLLLEYASDSASIATIWLSVDQSVTVGRTAKADYVIAGDAQMSSLHFRVECGQSGCRVRDLSSTNGTFLNGQKVVDAVIHDGDCLLAGSTRFSVRIESPRLPESADSPRALERISIPSDPRDRHAASDAATVLVNPVKMLCMEKSGGLTPQSYWLAPGQVLAVGRDATNDLAIPNDTTLSRRHFQVSCAGDECRVRDLGSSTGTLLNGRAVQDAMLRNGDRIRAGITEFLITIRRDQTATAAGGPSPGCRAAECVSGLNCFQPLAPQPSWWDLTQLVRASHPACAVVHCVAGASVRPFQPVMLLDWLPPMVAAKMSPWVLPADELASFQPSLDAAWGRDAVCVVFSRLPQQQLLALLRRLARGQSRATMVPSPPQMLTDFRPSALARVLTSGPVDYLSAALDGVDAFLIEASTPAGWQILAPPQFADTLERLGFAVASSAESTT
jgi:pSer/pThr/pTyr-binding forkhead associated (FHA) protein